MSMPRTAFWDNSPYECSFLWRGNECATNPRVFCLATLRLSDDFAPLVTLFSNRPYTFTHSYPTL